MTDRFGIQPFCGVGGDNNGRLAPGPAAKNQSLDIAAGENPAFGLLKIGHQCIKAFNNLLSMRRDLVLIHHRLC